MTTTTLPTVCQVAEAAGFNIYDETCHTENNIIMNQRLFVEKGDTKLQLEAIRWADPDVSGYLGNVGNALDDDDTSYDHFDSIGITPDQALIGLLNQLWGRVDAGN